MEHGDEPQVPAEQGVEPHGDRLPKDPFLATLVKGIDRYPGNEIGVILHVNGVIISGMLCSMTSFFEANAELIRRLGSPETVEGREWLAEIFDSLAEGTRPRLDAEQTKGDDDVETEAAEADLPDFIHLRAAAIHVPGTDAYLPETLWRGRLDHVSGWSIGNFGPKPPPRNSATT